MVHAAGRTRAAAGDLRGKRSGPAGVEVQGGHEADAKDVLVCLVCNVYRYCNDIH